MSKTIAVHARYKSLYISLPSSAKEQREMTKFSFVYGTRTTIANFWYFHLELDDVIAYLTRGRFQSSWRTEQILTVANFAGKI